MGKQESFISVVSLSKHILRNRGYRTYGKSFYVGALRFLVLTDELRALEYYDEFSRVIKDNRADKNNRADKDKRPQIELNWIGLNVPHRKLTVA